MPRSVVEDQLQSFRFRIFEVADGAGVFDGEVPVAGFNTVTTPNITIEQSEHRLGNQRYTRKFLGVPTIEDCTMTRGLMVENTTFYNWIIGKYLAKQPFRADFVVNVYNQEGDGTLEGDTVVRSLSMFECIPTSVKLMGDLDASSSDVNIEEVTCAVERIDQNEGVSIPETTAGP
jgi:phage tail-like protein